MGTYSSTSRGSSEFHYSQLSEVLKDVGGIANAKPHQEHEKHPAQSCQCEQETMDTVKAGAGHEEVSSIFIRSVLEVSKRFIWVKNLLIDIFRFFFQFKHAPGNLVQNYVPGKPPSPCQLSSYES